MHVVTGAAGFIGSHLVDALLARGEPVAACVRSGDDLRWLDGKPVHLRMIDVCTGEGLPEALADATVLYHLAGLTGNATAEDLERVNCGGTATVLQAARDHAPRLERAVFASSTIAAGPSTRDRPRREDDPCEPMSTYGQSKLHAEARVRENPELPWVIARIAGVYGPRDLSFLTLFRLAARHLFVMVGSGYRKTSFIYVGDAVRGLIALAEAPGVEHDTIHLTDEPVDWHDIGRAVTAGVDRWTVPIPLPAPLVLAVGEAMELRYRVTGIRNVINRRKAKEMLQPGWWMSQDKAEAVVGFRAEVHLDEGFGITGRWYRDHGWLGADPR